MEDKISKLKNLVKKYGILNTFRKAVQYVYSNYIVRISIKERIYIAVNRKKLSHILNSILDKNEYERIVIWRSSFGWDVPLYQRPQHIFNNFAKQKTLVFYEVTSFTDNVKRIKKEANNLYLVNFTNTAFSKIFFKEISQRKCPKYVQFYSTDWTLSAKQIGIYIKEGYQIIYEYIDDLSPHLAGTDKLPVNVEEKYNLAMRDKEIFVVVTANALLKDVLAKRGSEKLVFSCNGVDYAHFHDEIDEHYKLDEEFCEVLTKNEPLIGYYGALAKWFDYDLLKKIAETQKYQIVLFGIKYDDAYDKSGVDKYENIHFLGSKNYAYLQNYASHIDVLTIPFLINDITKATSPVKLFEYMALNKPIVTTDMDECRKYESVFIGHDHEEFIKQLDFALTKANDKAYIDLLDKEALENTWEEKSKVILDELRVYETYGQELTKNV